MSRLTPALLLPLLLTLPACGGNDEGAVEVETAPEEVGQPDLLGTWTVTEVDGRVPTREVRLQFTPQGELIRSEGSQQQRATYTFAGVNEVEVADATGVTRYEVEVRGANDVLLRTSGQTLRLARRGASVDLSTVEPAPAVTATASDTTAAPDTTTR